MFDLNTLITDPSWILQDGLGINNVGQIVGDGLHNGQSHAFLLNPLPIICLLYDSKKAVNSGATYPIKLQLCDGNGNDLSSSTITLQAISVTQISSLISGQLQSSGNANPDNDFRFDSTLGTTGGYIFNLSTKGLTTGTYNLNFTVSGGPSIYAASFQVK